jgi:hypothetical protein
MSWQPPETDVIVGRVAQPANPVVRVPVTRYSLGADAGGPDELQDSWTNKGYSSTGQNLTPGVAAVNEKAFPLGTIFRDKETGQAFIAADRHGNKNPNVVDVYTDPENYRMEKQEREFEIVGQVEEIPKDAQGVRELLSQYGTVPDGRPAVESLAARQQIPAGDFAGPLPTGGGGVQAMPEPGAVEEWQPPESDPVVGQVQQEQAWQPPESDPVVGQVQQEQAWQPPADDEIVGRTTLGGQAQDWWNQFARGATSDGGIYSMLEGAARGVANMLPEDAPVNFGPEDEIKTDWWADLGKSLRTTLEGQADLFAKTRKDIRGALPVSREFQESLTGAIVAGFGQVPAALGSYAIPGFGPLMAMGNIYDEAYQDARGFGLDNARAHDAALKAVPAAALEVVADKFVLGKILTPLKGKMTVGDLAKTLAAGSAMGGTTEGAQQGWLNFNAKYLSGYDPERKLDDEVIKSMIVGAVVDGTVSTGGRALQGVAAARTAAEQASPSRIAGVNAPGQPMADDASVEGATVAEPVGDERFAPPEMRGETVETPGAVPVEADSNQQGATVAESTPDVLAAERKVMSAMQNPEAGAVDVGLIVDGLTEYGRAIYRAGMSFAQWAGEMVRKFGEAVRPYLQAAWDAVSTGGGRFLPGQAQRGAVGTGNRGPKMDKRRFAESVKASPNVNDDVKAAIGTLFYEVQGNSETVARAKERINREGIEAELARQLSPTRVQDAVDVAAGIEMLGRLQTLGRSSDAAAVGRAIATKATSQAQAVQAMSLLSKFDAQGIDMYARQAVAEAAAAGGERTRAEAQDLARIEHEWMQVNRTIATNVLSSVRANELGMGANTKMQTQEVLRAVREALAQGQKRSEQIAAVRRVLDAAGVPKAESVAKKLVTRYYSEGTTIRRELLERLAGATGKQRIKKLLQMLERGDLDDARMFQTVAAALGVPYWSADQSVRVKSLAEKLQAEADPERKLVLAARMWDVVHESMPPGVWSRVNAIRNMAMLLNPKTMIRNIGGNAIFFGLNLTADMVSTWGIDPFVKLVTGRRTRTSLAVGERFVGLGAPVADIRNGMRYAEADGMKGFRVFQEGVSHMLTLAKLNALGKWDFTTVKEGTGKIFSDPVMGNLENLLSLSLSVPDRGFHQAQFRASLANQMAAANRNGLNVVSPTREMMAQAMEDAAYAIYQDENYASKFLTRFRKALNAGAGFGIGSVILPFAQVPGSIAAKGIEFSPLGFVRSVYEVVAPTVKGRAFNQRAFVDSLARASVGSGAMGAGLYLAWLGVMSALGDDDRDLDAMRRASGLGQFGINVSELYRRILSGDWLTQSKGPMAGDVVVNYDWVEPAAMPIAMGAEFWHQRQENERRLARGVQPGAMDSAVGMSMLAAARSLEDQPLLQGISKLASNVGYYGAVGGVGATGMDLPGQFVPTIVRQVGQMLDNTVRETRAGSLVDQRVNALLASLPGASENYPPRYDIFGQAQERYQYGGASVFNVFFNPSMVRIVSENPAAAEVLRIAQLTGDNGVVPNHAAISSSQRSVRLPGVIEPVELTNEQLSEYARLSGVLWANAAGRVVASPNWAEAPAGTKARVLGRVTDMVGNYTRLMLIGGDEELKHALREELIRSYGIRQGMMQER